MRLIVDTNVVVSALLVPQSVPRQAFDKARAVGVLIASEETLAELVATLHKPKLAPYITPFERAAFLKAFVREVEIHAPADRVHACRDPRDNMFLELALAGHAEWLVTGDRDLLALASFDATRIVTPADFLNTPPGTDP